ncbi:MAG: MgtC/SapB family protein [Bacilli bacterium]|nr:MgtC/SapB family protein [Bacilli bacterium]
MESFLIRIALCYILSISIGFERQLHNKVTGLRTNVLVALGAFLFVYYSFGPYIEGDQMRIAASVVSGIGFLGAGVILRNGNRITGLNTAATLWCSAAIGVLTARGMLLEAIIGSILILLSNIILRVVSLTLVNKFRNDEMEKCSINLICDEALDIVIRTKIADIVEKNRFKLILLDKSYIDKDNIKLKFSILANDMDVIERFIKELSGEAGVSRFAWSHKKALTNGDDEIYGEDEG